MESAHVEYEIKGRKRFDNEFSKEMRLENEREPRFVVIVALYLLFSYSSYREWMEYIKGI
mgnify:CR=1 FL=1